MDNGTHPNTLLSHVYRCSRGCEAPQGRLGTVGELQGESNPAADADYHHPAGERSIHPGQA